MLAARPKTEAQARYLAIPVPVRLPIRFAVVPEFEVPLSVDPSMAGEDGSEEAAIERQLEQQLEEQKESLDAVNQALASDPSNPELHTVHEELLLVIKDAEEGLLHLKRTRLLKEAGAIFSSQGRESIDQDVKVEPLDPRQIQPEPLESEKYSIGEKCRFRHTDGRWYNGRIVGFEGMVLPTSSLKQHIPTIWQQSLVGSSIWAISGGHSGIWRKAELESWDDEIALAQVVFQDDGSSAKLGTDALSISEYAEMSDDEDDDSSSGTSEYSEEEEDGENETGHQGIGFLDATTTARGIQTDTALFAKWEHHTRGIASKMMASMGYREGMGLGVSGQGMVDPITVKVLQRRQSLDHAVASNETEENRAGQGKKRSRGGKRKRDKKYAEAVRAAKAEERESDVFSFINAQLAGQDVANGSRSRHKKGTAQARIITKKEDRRSLIAYDDEVKELRNRIEKLEEMVNRNRKDKPVYEAASRKLSETRKALADAEAAHASASSAVVNKEKEKRWLKF
ncbi:Zinc finger CCCH domain-containing protein 18 [Cocos nucifera]|uniref:Zinc finger CCCH domain-containing protein 18 n=1 Tax=Cocos nucifera TaxID=13894 RepID=A0A8K0MTY9_COCNU|nr:Zinc finger CCCH domain-containing protein 18 [Cocos nucifera]